MDIYVTFHQIKEVSGHYFHSLLFLVSIWDFHLSYVDMFDDVPQDCESVTFLFNFFYFCLFFELNHFYGSIFKFTDFFLASQKCRWDNLLKWPFQLLCFSTLKFLFGFSYSLFFSMETPNLLNHCYYYFLIL